MRKQNRSSAKKYENIFTSLAAVIHKNKRNAAYNSEKLSTPGLKHVIAYVHAWASGGFFSGGGGTKGFFQNISGVAKSG